MNFLYPKIEPFDSGLLEVADKTYIYWEASGNPNGTPVLFLHGGPGAGLKTGYRRYYDPDKFRIISFEQRGCGRSRPLITDSFDNIAMFNTKTLISDIEQLRQYLNVSSWLISGISWGTTLALAYAQTHPVRVKGLVLAAINLATPTEVKWITETMGAVFPEAWQEFRLAVQPAPSQSVIDAYYERIIDREPSVRKKAYDAWCKWEDVHVSLDPLSEPYPSFEDEEFRAVFATQVIHFWKHAAFMGECQILSNMTLLSAIPGVLIHGRLDVSSPVKTAWELNEAWDSGTLVIIEDEGHGGPKMIEALVKAVHELKL